MGEGDSMQERRKMLGQLIYGLQPRRRDGNLHPFRGTSPGGKVLSKHPSPAESARGRFCSCPLERALRCVTTIVSHLQSRPSPSGGLRDLPGQPQPCMIKAWLHHLHLGPQSCPC